MPAELDIPELPECVTGLWSAFLALNAARGSSGFGPMPIGFSDLRDYAEIIGWPISAWEADTVMEMDRAALSTLAAKD